MNMSANYEHVYTTISVVRKKPFQCFMLYELNVSLDRVAKGIEKFRKEIRCPANAIILDKGVSYIHSTRKSFSIMSFDCCGCGVRLTEASGKEEALDSFLREKKRWPLTAKLVLRFLINPRIEKMLKNNQRKYQGRFLGCNYTIALPCLDALFGKGDEGS